MMMLPYATQLVRGGASQRVKPVDALAKILDDARTGVDMAGGKYAIAVHR